MLTYLFYALAALGGLVVALVIIGAVVVFFWGDKIFMKAFSDFMEHMH